MKPLRLLVVLALLAGSAALALAAPVAPVTPLPAPLPSVGQQGAVALVPSSTCPLLYSNTANLSGYYFPAGAGVEVADDLHMVGPGHLCGIDIGYFKESLGPTSAAIAFYANDPTDGIPPFMLLAGPYVVSDLPSGVHVLHLDLEPGVGMPDVTEDIWLGISFSTDSTGLLLSDPPTLGSSHGGFYWTPPGEYTPLCNGMPGNFCLAVYANEFTVPVTGTTWGSLKRLYR